MLPKVETPNELGQKGTTLKEIDHNRFWLIYCMKNENSKKKKLLVPIMFTYSNVLFHPNVQ